MGMAEEPRKTSVVAAVQKWVKAVVFDVAPGAWPELRGMFPLHVFPETVPEQVRPQPVVPLVPD